MLIDPRPEKVEDPCSKTYALYLVGLFIYLKNQRLQYVANKQTTLLQL